LEEVIPSGKLDLADEIIKFDSPIKIKADIYRVVDVVTIDLSLSASMSAICSRCIEKFNFDFKKQLDLNFPVESPDMLIDLDQEIREEIIIDYSMKPLCRPDCKGLCPKCGKNLNQGGCSCGST